MDSKTFLMFALPVFLGPIFIDLAVGLFRKKSNYRANDLMTNLSLSMLSTLVGIAAAAVTLGGYAFIYNEYALFVFENDRLFTWLVALMTYDFLYYWTHRAHHSIALLWVAHVVHHSGEDMNFGLSLRQSFFSELTMWVFFLPMALLGISPEIYLIVTAVQLVYQYLIHNTYVGCLSSFEKILVTPSQHRVHHGWNRIYIDKNYGNIFVFWDRLFGTYQPEIDAEPPLYGLYSGVKSWNPLTINFKYLQELVSLVGHSRGVDKVRVLIMGPGWQPTSLPVDLQRGSGNNISTAADRKYDPKISLTSNGYGLFQLLMSFVLFASLLWAMENLNSVEIATSVGFIFGTAFMIGGLLDRRTWFWHFEIFRLAALACLLLVGVLLEQQSILKVAVVLGLYCGVSLLYLFCFRLDFNRAMRCQLSN